MVIRIQNACIRDVKGWNIELFKHNLGHALSVGRRIPCWFSDKDWMFSCVTSHDIVNGMFDQWFYWVEVLD